jgi:hypothetical protein
MSMFNRNPQAQENQVPQAGWSIAEVLLEDLAETSWLLSLAQVGLGFNPDLLALAERRDQPAGPPVPVIGAYRPVAGTQALR